MAKVIIGAFFAGLLFFIQSAAAIEIDGSDDPQFRKAVKAWLDDDDPGSLPTLSKLATEGNTAARYLLGQIERTTHFGSETQFARTLDREQRIALFRSPGGLFGTSWIEILKDDKEELATILISLKDPRYEKEQLATLIRMGEDHIAMRELIREISLADIALLLSWITNSPCGMVIAPIFGTASCSVQRCRKLNPRQCSGNLVTTLRNRVSIVP